VASKSIIEQPDAIIVTLPARFFEEQNHAAYLKELQDLEAGHVWYRVCKNLPKHDVLYVYTIIDNKIHHRANFVGVERNKNYRFSRPDGQYRDFTNVNAILTTGPVEMAPQEIRMKGFQGFRYTKILF
jgi:hypothetical protein